MLIQALSGLSRVNYEDSFVILNNVNKLKEMTLLFRAVFIALVLTVTHVTHADNRIKIAQIDVKFSLYQTMARRVLEEAYSRMGKTIEFKNYPAARSLIIANSGGVDGELARIAGLQKKYTNLVMIPVPIAYDEVLAFTKNQQIDVESWQSLESFRIDIIKGFKLAERKTKGMNVETVATTEQGLGKVHMNRSDIFIGLVGVRCFISKHKFTDIKPLTPKLDKLVMYHYLHKRHSDLAVKLEKTLKEMEENGEIEEIKKQTKEALLDQCSLK